MKIEWFHMTTDKLMDESLRNLLVIQFVTRMAWLFHFDIEHVIRIRRDSKYFDFIHFLCNIAKHQFWCNTGGGWTVTTTFNITVDRDSTYGTEKNKINICSNMCSEVKAFEFFLLETKKRVDPFYSSALHWRGCRTGRQIYMKVQCNSRWNFKGKHLHLHRLQNHACI
jgi:hypothetical protein